MTILELKDEADITESIGYFMDSIVLLNSAKKYRFSIIAKSELVNYLVTDFIFKNYETSAGYIDFDPNLSNSCDYIILVNENMVVSIMPLLFDYNVEELEDSQDVFISNQADQRIVDYCLGLDKQVYLF